MEASVHGRSYTPWEDQGDSEYEWIQTSSGEWLKGELKDVRDDELEIDSDEFDLQILDWDDVEEMHLPNRFVFVLEDQSTYVGSAEMSEGRIVVMTKRGARAFDKSRLMSIVPAHRREISNWSYRLSVGATTRRGNTESVDYSAFSRLRREDAFQRATLEYNGAFGLVRDELNTNKHRGTLYWDLYLSKYFYLAPLWSDALYDEFQNIEVRGLVASGAGVHAVDNKKLRIDVQAALGYAGTKFISVEPEQDPYQHGMLVVPQLALEWDITGDIEFEALWSSSLVVTELSQSFHHATARFEIDITDIFDFDISAIYDRQEGPVADADGNIPYKDDLSTTVGISLELE